jgi:putative Holliday junction resolvase
LGKYLGIDYGSARIGLATADTDAKLASPLKAVGAHELAAILASEGPFEAVIVGLPRGLDGQETAQTLAVRRFTDDILGDRHGIEPVFQDEAGTSGVAEDHLKESGRKYSKGDIDAEAAAIILQDYLDNL